jgi:hypothetical protein
MMQRAWSKSDGSLTFSNAIPPNHPGGTFFLGRFVR